MLGRIAIHLGKDAGLARRLDTAIKLAGQNNAELVGVYPAGPSALSYDDPVIPSSLTKMLRDREADVEAEVKALFTEKTEQAGVKAQWRAPRGPAEDSLALHARYCDLLIMSKVGKEAVNEFNASLPEAVIMAAGRPVLMIPAVGAIPSIGKRILFCWDHRREAARAFADAAPFLESCSELVVLCVDHEPGDLRYNDVQADDFAAFCAARGYPKPLETIKKSEGIGVGNVILNTATDHGSDLIVMGAYGHSRMRRWIMGGASEVLLGSMTVPVLLSH